MNATWHKAGRRNHKNLPSDVLHQWFTDDRFTDGDGCPLYLPFSNTTNSFSELVRLCGGDIPPGAMRDELLRVGAIKVRPDGLLAVVRREFVPADIDGRLIEGLDYGLRMLASTIVFNTSPSRKGKLRFQRVASSDCVRASDARFIEDEVSKRLGEYLENVDDQISKYEIRDSNDDSTVEFGVGFFVYVDDKEKARR